MVLKTMPDDRPVDPRRAAALRREAVLLHGLAIRGVVRAIDFDESGPRPVLVLEDVGAQDLGEWLDGRRIDLESFLALAIPLAETLGALHQHGILHRDINPGNIVLDAQLRPTLIDFETATCGATWAPSLEAQSLQGTLAFLAPEQTGRMQCPVDRRADLYALGAVYYQMLTGAPPLSAPDPAALVHAILASAPVAPSQLRPDLPPQLSELIMKLLAKMPELRYQTAEALVADLETGQRYWLTGGKIPRFDLGTADRRDELEFPDELFGRHEQLAELLRAFKRVKDGQRELAFVVGPAGIGKTALASELERHIGGGAWFCSGKAEPLTEVVPYGVFRAALRSLLREAGARAPALVDALRERLQRALGGMVRILVDLAPELEPLLGPQAALPSIGPRETEQRLEFALLTLLRTCATRERPLVVFLDDLQWADPGSLRLLELIARAPNLDGLLVVCAYRSDPAVREVEALLERLRGAHTPALRIDLGALDRDAIAAWLSAILSCSTERTGPLADVVLARTRGDPLFVRRLLELLHRAGLLARDPIRGDWHWDLPAITQLPVGEDALAMMIAALHRLPAESQQALAVAACIGSHFDVWLLAQASGQHLERAARALAPALQEGLLADAPQRFHSEIAPGVLDLGIGPACRFVHDRVLEAARALVTKDAAEALHVRVARALLATPSAAELERRLFEIVEHFHCAVAQLTAREDRLFLCELELKAARKASAAAAHASALTLSLRALALLPLDEWDTHHRLALELHCAAASGAYLTDRVAIAEELLAAVFPRARSAIERAELHEAALVALTARADYAGAIAHARAALQELDCSVPEPPAVAAAAAAELHAVEKNRDGRAIEALLDAPEMRSPEAFATARLLQQLAVAAFLADQALLEWAILRLVNLSLLEGNAPESGPAYAFYGQIQHASYPDDLAAGRAFANLGVATSRRFDRPDMEARALAALGGMINHWSASMRTSVPILADAAAKLLQAGDLPLLAFVRGLEVLTFLAMGQPLARLRAQVEAATKQHPGDAGLLVCRQALRCLQGDTHGATRFDDAQCDQQALDTAVATSQTCAGLYEVLRLQVAYLARDFELARRMAHASVPHLPFLNGFISIADHNFYSSLTCAALADGAETEAPALLARIAANQRQLELWARRCPENFSHKHLLVAAEVARLEGRPIDASDLYDRAIEGAAREGFTQDEALAHELAGRARLALGRTASGLPHLAAAWSAYLRWGATSKARALFEEYPALADGRSWFGIAISSEERAAQAFDLLSIIKASEAISRELEPSLLLDRLMAVCLEAGGAQRGALVLEEEGGPMLRAVAELGQPVDLDPRPLEASGLVPGSIIEATRRSAQALVLNDAALHPHFAEDPYIAERHVRSVLALPIMRQAIAIGVLYLENNLATRAFTPERVRVLSLLSSQIAVSLAHSRLFVSFGRELEERRRAEAALRFLAEASAGLSESLDYRVILDRVARAAVPFMADGCIIDVIMQDDQRISSSAVAHVDPTKEALLHELHGALPRWDSNDPIAQRLRSGEPIVLPELSDQVFAEQHVDHEFVVRSRALGIRSTISLPLIAHGSTIGVMHLGSTAVGRRYGAADLQLARELAHRCAMAIENAYLYHEAKEAIAVRDEFLSIASHELRTPLTALQLAVQGLVRRSPRSAGGDGAGHRQLELIDRQTQRLTRLVDMLLEVSRIHAGGFELELEELDLGGLIEDVAERFAPELARAGSGLTLSLQPSVIGFWDPLRLEEVLTNLLSNAIKFGAGGPIAIELETAHERVRLRVRDRGIGVPPERQPHIFERFERAVPARSYGGLGLGLYITRRIVEALGGTIGVESRPGVGSTFTVELPRDCRPGALGGLNAAVAGSAT